MTQGILKQCKDSKVQLIKDKSVPKHKAKKIFSLASFLSNTNQNRGNISVALPAAKQISAVLLKASVVIYFNCPKAIYPP